MKRNELIKSILGSDEKMSTLNWTYAEKSYFFRVEDSCYRADVEKGASKIEIVKSLYDCSKQYNFIKNTDNKYIDGFIFPEELEKEDDADNYCCCIFEKEDGKYVPKNRLGLAIHAEIFESVIGAMSK